MTEEIFIKHIGINKVRHLENLQIPVSGNERKHIIFTGINGSGKTSVLLTLVDFLRNCYGSEPVEPIAVQLNIDYSNLVESVRVGNFIIAFFPAKRDNQAKAPQGINKVYIKSQYGIEDKANTDFIQYIVNLKADRSFAKDDNRTEEVRKIDEWFDYFEKALFTLFDKDNTRLEFDRKNYNFNIIEPGKNPYNLNQLSDGYSAILDIVTELIMRMEKNHTKSYDIQGVVLIDEIETHLHIELQKKILPFLIAFFPKIQFIVSTHSPFVISSIDNAVICDLEKRTVIDEDLSAYTSEALVENYFDSDQYSNLLKNEVAEYETLISTKFLTPEQTKRLDELEFKFAKVSEVSDELTVQIQQIKLANLSKTN
jgi:predicted ATP-binding protein involved in virulence